MKRMLPIGHMASGARLAIAALLTLVSAFSATHAGDHPQVDGLIAAGEFGAAVDVAEQEDPITKAELMQRIVYAQIQAGDLNNAENSLPLFAGQGNPRGVRGDLARNQMLNGGVVADFDSLIELIQNQTSGPWMEIDGIGANRPEEYESGVRVDPAG
ncbi:MAG: hypothetical protein KDA80_16990, partial [Planctomycetaceae bacterium]|nr:hypothetical protein [Planctomycetaceae bacterium]